MNQRYLWYRCYNSYIQKSGLAVDGIAGKRPWLDGSVKYWFTDDLAIDGVLGYRWNFHIQAHLTYNLDKFIDFPK